MWFHTPCTATMTIYTPGSEEKKSNGENGQKSVRAREREKTENEKAAKNGVRNTYTVTFSIDLVKIWCGTLLHAILKWMVEIKSSSNKKSVVRGVYGHHLLEAKLETGNDTVIYSIMCGILFFNFFSLFFSLFLHNFLFATWSWIPFADTITIFAFSCSFYISFVFHLNERHSMRFSSTACRFYFWPTVSGMCDVSLAFPMFSVHKI